MYKCYPEANRLGKKERGREQAKILNWKVNMMSISLGEVQSGVGIHNWGTFRN